MSVKPLEPQLQDPLTKRRLVETPEPSLCLTEISLRDLDLFPAVGLVACNIQASRSARPELEVGVVGVKRGEHG